MAALRPSYCGAALSAPPDSRSRADGVLAPDPLSPDLRKSPFSDEINTILVEIGTDVSRFSSGSHLACWARVCPSNDESAGKRRSSHIGPGSPWLRGTLVEAAWAASYGKHTYLATQYRRLAARRGAKRALVAVAHTILMIANHIIRDGTTYQDLGSKYFGDFDRQATLRRSVKRLEPLGYKVTVEAAQPRPGDGLSGNIGTRVGTTIL